MVDIAKCSRMDCGKRMSCFRYIADSDDFGQTFIVPDKDLDVENGCDMYWKVKDKYELAYLNKINRQEVI